jgi:hypothetical protein
MRFTATRRSDNLLPAVGRPKHQEGTNIMNVKEIATTLAILGSGALLVGCGKDKPTTEVPAGGDSAVPDTATPPTGEASCGGADHTGEGHCGDEAAGGEAPAEGGEAPAEGGGEAEGEGSCGGAA